MGQVSFCLCWVLCPLPPCVFHQDLVGCCLVFVVVSSPELSLFFRALPSGSFSLSYSSMTSYHSLLLGVFRFVLSVISYRFGLLDLLPSFVSLGFLLGVSCGFLPLFRVSLSSLSLFLLPVVLPRMVPFGFGPSSLCWGLSRCALL